MLIFVSGGARSGKSEWAERTALSLSHDVPRIYLATARVTDEDMKARVERHRAQRSGRGFVTVERPCGMTEIAGEIPMGAVVLLECLPNWAANEMFRADGSIACIDDVRRAVEGGLAALMNRAGHLIAVSDDIFSDGMKYDFMTEDYMRLLGRLHISIASAADVAAECAFGTVRIAKGDAAVLSVLE